VDEVYVCLDEVYVCLDEVYVCPHFRCNSIIIVIYVS
jgi:hypothetical protein